MSRQPDRRTRAMKSTSITRRLLLRGVGAAGLVAPILARSRPARGAEPPRRLILFHTANGIEPLRTPPPSFVAQVNDLLILDGVDWRANSAINNSNAHLMGPNGAFTADIAPDGRAKGPSVDRFIIDRVKPQTRFESLDLGVHTDQNVGSIPQAAAINYSLTGGSIQVESSPRKAFDRLFTGTALGGTTVEATARLRARKQSILDHLVGELNTLRPRLTAEERIRVDGHLTSLRAIEKRLADPTASGLAGAGGAASTQALDGRITTAGAVPIFPTTGELQMDLMVLAFAMGLTNIATLRWGHGVSAVRHTWIGSMRDMHAGLAHGEGGAGSGDEFRRVIYWYGEQYMALVNRLKATAEAGGVGTLYDNTLLLWNSDMTNGSHGWRNGLMILAGRLGGAVRPGRTAATGGASLNGVLADVCAAMGAPTPAFGNPNVPSAPLNLLA